jgi:outer membrane receptor protein involved in Fe transport
MKIKATLLLLLSSIAMSFAQSATVSGKILDKSNNSSIPYATIVIKLGDKIITGGITDEKGEFTLDKIALGTYDLEVQFIGYKSHSSQISVHSKNLNAGTIYLSEDALSLAEVEVVGERTTIEQKIDRKVVNVGPDLINSGPTASDILNNIPSVSVDPQNNSVTLRGNPNVQIFIDGKPSQMSASQALQQIPSTSIKQVELITNPSAKYNPEGMSGIINIILKKNSNLGFNGSVNAGTNFGITPKGNTSLDLNYRVNKFNFYSTYSINNGKWNNRGFVDTEDELRPNNSNRANFVIDNFNQNHFVKAGVDFYMSEKNTLSFFTNQNFNTTRGEFFNEVIYKNGINPNVIQLNKSKNVGQNQVYNLGYRHEFDKADKKLDIEINYNRNDRPEDSVFLDGNNNLLQSNLIETIGENVIMNLDFVNPLDEKTKLELGLESRFDGTDNTFDLDNTYFSDFDYKRTIQSAYANYGKQFEKWSYQLGARLENFQVEANFRRIDSEPGQFKDAIFTVYPSAFVSYVATEKDNFNFSYSRRVDRPSLGQVNPIRDWSSPTIDQEGNPNLNPQFTNSFEVNYTRTTKIGAITSGVFFRYINDPISQVFIQSPYDENKKLMTYGNFESTTEYGIETSGNLNFKKWWSVNFGADVYFRNANGVIENAEGDLAEKSVLAVPFNARMNHNLTLSKKLKLTWFTLYRAGVDDIQFSNKEMWRTDLGVRYSILKDQGSISLRVNDIFNTMRARFYGEIPELTFGQFRWESRMVNVNFNYRFGSGKNRALQRKQRDQNETQGGGLF